MTKIKEIIDFMDNWAPEETAMSWDNVGLQIGDYNDSKEIKVIDVLLDFNISSLEALRAKDTPDLIITHHPFIFKPLSKIDLGTKEGRILEFLIKSNTSLFTSHTNLDRADGGVNDCLIKYLSCNVDLKKVIKFNGGIGGWFELQVDYSNEFVIWITNLLNTKVIKNGDRIAFCGGQGSSIITEIIRNKIKWFITGELGYHDKIRCDLNGVNVIELGHYESERPVLREIINRLQIKFLHIKVNSVG